MAAFRDCVLGLLSNLHDGSLGAISGGKCSLQVWQRGSHIRAPGLARSRILRCGKNDEEGVLGRTKDLRRLRDSKIGDDRHDVGVRTRSRRVKCNAEVVGEGSWLLFMANRKISPTMPNAAT